MLATVPCSLLCYVVHCFMFSIVKCGPQCNVFYCVMVSRCHVVHLVMLCTVSYCPLCHGFKLSTVPCCAFAHCVMVSCCPLCQVLHFFILSTVSRCHFVHCVMISTVSCCNRDLSNVIFIRFYVFELIDDDTKLGLLRILQAYTITVLAGPSGPTVRPKSREPQRTSNTYSHKHKPGAAGSQPGHGFGYFLHFIFITFLI